MKKIISLALACLFAVSAFASSPSADTAKKVKVKKHHAKKVKDSAAKM